MKLKKLLSACSSYKTDSTMPVVALLAGLAVGAVVGILFAPQSGENTRGKIADKAGDLAETFKDKVQRVKNKLHAEGNDAAQNTDKILNEVKKKAANKLHKAKEEVKSKIKGAADEANDALQDA